MEIIFQTLVTWIDSSKYFLLFIGCIVEGPIVMIASGFLYRLGQFDLLPMYLALISGDFTADIGWYCIGRFGTRNKLFRYGHFLGITPEKLATVEKLSQKYQRKILIISKLTMGLGFAMVVLIVAGIFKIPFKNYVTLNLIGGFMWTALLLTFGYVFGNVFTMVSGTTKIILLLAGISGIITIIHIVNTYMQKQNTISI